MYEPQVRISTSSSLKFFTSMEAWHITDWLESVPSHATITVHQTKGDMRERSETTLTATWDPTKEQK